MCGISYKCHSTSTVIPRLSDPVADVGLVHGGVIWDPCECGPRRLRHFFGPLFDQRKSLCIAERVVRIGKPRHCKVEDPGFWVIFAIWHARDYTATGSQLPYSKVAG